MRASADLLEHLGEIEERKIHLDGPYSSMFGFCLGEYGFSEDVAYQRITVARADVRPRLHGTSARLALLTVGATGDRLLVSNSSRGGARRVKRCAPISPSSH